GQYEVTTYRIDGKYSDARHPDAVEFTGELTQDLARRDFTVNAMAMGVDENGEALAPVDPFGGEADLDRGVLRCVGEPDERFREDALRILRAIRFAGRLGLDIEPRTRQAMLDNHALLEKISAERVMDELGKILLTDRGCTLLAEMKEILLEAVPELGPCVGFEQNNPWHCHTVFDHIMLSVVSAPKDLTLRLTMLLHDVGKPAAATTDENGSSHFYGHNKLSAELAEKALRRLRCPNRLINDVVELIDVHDVELTERESSMRRLLNRMGEEQARRLLKVRRADTLAQSEMAKARKLDSIDRCEALLEKLISEHQIFALKDLAISGRDLIEHGVAPGWELGERLKRALDAVLDGKAENEREALLKIALE
ncbi:MAG: HD domain-containing protein, partial [Oscillospiraceae bacterium]|nr:HD domain-containing protein [Oscillospiraceae bacterium]